MMRIIVAVHLDKRRPALILTRHSKLHLLTWVTVAPITTVRKDSVGDTIGLFLDDHEPALARAISDAFDLALI